MNKTMDNVLKEHKFDPIKGIGNSSLNRLSNNSIIHYFPDVDCFLYDAAYKSFSAFYDTSTRNEWSNNRVWFFVENSYKDALKKAFRFSYMTVRRLLEFKESFTISLWDPQDAISEIGVTFYSNRYGFQDVELEDIHNYSCPFLRISISPD